MNIERILEVEQITNFEVTTNFSSGDMYSFNSVSAPRIYSYVSQHFKK